MHSLGNYPANQPLCSETQAVGQLAVVESGNATRLDRCEVATGLAVKQSSRNADVALARHIITPLLENAHLHFYWNLVYQNIRWKSLLTCQLSRLEI